MEWIRSGKRKVENRSNLVIDSETINERQKFVVITFSDQFHKLLIILDTKVGIL